MLIKKNLLLFALFILCSTINAQTNLSGFITKDSIIRKDKSPYKLTDNFCVYSNAKLTIEKGTVIDLNQYGLIIDTGQLLADDVTFNHGQINFMPLSGGSITGSSLNGVYINFDQPAKPIINNNIFDAASEIYISKLYTIKNIDFSGNTFNDTKFKLTMMSADNQGTVNFKKLNNISYLIMENLDITNTELILEKGVSFNLNSNYLWIKRNNSTPCSIQADEAAFLNGSLSINDSTSGYLKGCTFTNCNTEIKRQSSILITGANFDASSELRIYSDLTVSNYGADNKHASGKIFFLPSGSKNVTINAVPSVEYNLLGNLTLQGMKLTINKNVNLNLGGHSINLNSSVKNDTIINIDSVRMSGGTLKIYKAALGFVKNCTFTGMNILSADTASVTLSGNSLVNSVFTASGNSRTALRNNSFDANSKYVCNSANGLDDMAGNSFISNSIDIGFNLNRELTLRKNDLVYNNTGINISSNGKLIIEKDVVLKNGGINILPEAFQSAFIIADGVVFDGGGLGLGDMSKQKITNCLIKNCNVNYTGVVSSEFRNNIFSGTSILNISSQESYDNLTSLFSGNTYQRRAIRITTIPTITTFNKLAAVDTLIFETTFKNNITIMKGYTITGGINLSPDSPNSIRAEFNGAVFINNININAYASSEAVFDECYFKGVRLETMPNSKMTVSRSDFGKSCYFINNSRAGTNFVGNYWGDPTGPSFSLNPGGKGATIISQTAFPDDIKFIPFSMVAINTTLGTDKNYQNNSPTSFMLYPNYPNPFNPSTEIKYSLDLPGHVSLKVYNILSQEVVEIVNEYQGPGVYSRSFQANNLPSGIYMAQLISGNKSAIIKMLLIK